MHPVFAPDVSHALVQTAGGEDQYEIPGTHHALDQLVFELPSLQFFHIKEDAEAMQLEMDFQETVRGRIVGMLEVPCWHEPKTSSDLMLSLQQLSWDANKAGHEL